MIRLAVVGDIGCGKSYVAKQFGCPVFNADAEVAKLYSKNKKCFTGGTSPSPPSPRGNGEGRRQSSSSSHSRAAACPPGSSRSFAGLEPGGAL